MFRPILLCALLLLWGSANAAVGGTCFLTKMLLNVRYYWHIMVLFIHIFFVSYELRDLSRLQQDMNGKMKSKLSSAALITWIQLNIPQTARLENWIVSIFANLGAKKIRSVRASPTFQRVSGAVISARLAATKKNPSKRYRLR